MNPIYKQKILDYYEKTEHKGFLENADFSATITNPLCGDQVTLSGFFEGNSIKIIKFNGQGCILSQASAAMIAGYAEKKPIKDLLTLDSEFVQKKLNIDNIGPTRIRCILLALEALYTALRE